MLSYEDTAYDSTRSRELPPPLPDQKRGLMARAWLKRKLGPLPVECGEYLTLGNVDGLRLLKKGELDGQVEEYPLQIHWPSRANPLFWIAVFRFWGLFLGIGCSAMSVLVLILGGPFNLFFWIAAAGFAVYFTLGLILKADKPTADDNFVLNRRTGMVHLPSGSRPRTIPFDEFAPYLHEYVSPNGFVTWALILGHEYSDFHLLGGDYREKWKVGLEWEYYRQFMDVSKPLPDVPHLEPDRALDPTTAEWDRRMGRPSGFWRSMPEETYAELQSQSLAATESFPWGRSRYDALFTAGWSASCYGIVTWWDTPEPTSKEESFRHWRRCLDAETMFKEPDPYRVQEYGRLVGLLRGAVAVRTKLLDTAKKVLAEYDLTPTDREKFVSYVEHAEKTVKTLASDVEEIEKTGPRVAIEGGLGDRGYVHGLWIHAIENEATIRHMMSRYEHPENEGAREAENGKIYIEAICAALNTLRVAGVTDTKTSPDRARETIAAFLVSLAQKEGTIRPDELRLLNHALGRESTAEQYLQQYGVKLTGNQAAEDITEMVTRLNEQNNKVAVLVYDYLEAMSRILIHADGDYEVAEWEQLSTLRELLGKAMGVEIEALPRPGEAS